ncbi:MotA/TolQ/ExbB proton channel family protein [Tepidiforma flava]|uniref:MotA/TolQ/ExbB proton channel family protein n=1 Tax=Tepidiforma flava TaxID=3004094 RepID=UPI003570C6BE
MSHLDEPDHIGPGIATAFVATFYGVFTANVTSGSPSPTSSRTTPSTNSTPSTSSSKASCPSRPAITPASSAKSSKASSTPSARGKKDDHAEARREAA